MEELSGNRRVVIDYTNWKGERRNRIIIPLRMVFTTTEFHVVEQWFILAKDLEKKEERHFALNSIHSWKKYLEVSSDVERD